MKITKKNSKKTFLIFKINRVFFIWKLILNFWTKILNSIKKLLKYDYRLKIIRLKNFLNRATSQLIRKCI
jgi:hypothetical protein